MSGSRRVSGEVFRGNENSPGASERRRSAAGSHRENAGKTETALLRGF